MTPKRKGKKEVKEFTAIDYVTFTVEHYVNLSNTSQHTFYREVTNAQVFISPLQW